MGGVIKYEGECVIIKYQCYHVDKVHQVASFSIDYPIFPNLKSKDLLRLTKGDWREVVEEIGIEELLEKEFTKLSLGQRKLIALACALSRSAEVYVLDEPTANVDVKKRDIIYNFINKKIKNAIISSHELQEIADLAKNVIIMNKGKVIFIGSLFELSKRFEGRYIIRTDRPEEMKERLGGERVFGNLVLVKGSSMEEIMEMAKELKDHILSIDKVNLSIIYKMMLGEEM